MHRDFEKFAILWACWMFFGTTVALIVYEATAESRQIPTVQLDVAVEVVDPGKVCAKATSILTGKYKMTAVAADAFLTHEGVAKDRKCLEVIFLEISSPTNGYKVHLVGSATGVVDVGVVQ